MIVLESTYIKPASQHPRSMLFNLQLLHIPDSQHKADRAAKTHEPNPRLCIDRSVECPPRNHKRTDGGHDPQQHRKPAAHSVDDDSFVPDDGRELQHCEYSGR